jgi:hypothetical protein
MGIKSIQINPKIFRNFDIFIRIMFVITLATHIHQIFFIESIDRMRSFYILPVTLVIFSQITFVRLIADRPKNQSMICMRTYRGIAFIFVLGVVLVWILDQWRSNWMLIYLLSLWLYSEIQWRGLLVNLDIKT